MCLTVKEVDDRLHAMQSNHDRRIFLELQLKARRYVIGSVNKNGVFNLSAGGKALPVEKLAANLKCSIRMASDEAEGSSRGRDALTPPCVPLPDSLLQNADAEKQVQRDGRKGGQQG